MKLVRLSRIDRLARTSSNVRMVSEYRKLRNELLNESPKYNREDAKGEVEEIASTILRHLCKMWLFFADKKAVNGWIDELVVKYRRAPSYGDNNIVLDWRTVKDKLWDRNLQRLVYKYLDDLCDPDISPKYRKLPHRTDYQSYIKDFIERLDSFYEDYAKALSKAGSYVARKSRIEANVGRKAYRNMSKMDKKNQQDSRSTIPREAFESALENSSLLRGYGEDSYEYVKNPNNHEY